MELAILNTWGVLLALCTISKLLSLKQPNTNRGAE